MTKNEVHSRHSANPVKVFLPANVGADPGEANITNKFSMMWQVSLLGSARRQSIDGRDSESEASGECEGPAWHIGHASAGDQRPRATCTCDQVTDKWKCPSFMKSLLEVHTGHFTVGFLSRAVVGHSWSAGAHLDVDVEKIPRRRGIGAQWIAGHSAFPLTIFASSEWQTEKNVWLIETRRAPYFAPHPFLVCLFQ